MWNACFFLMFVWFTRKMEIFDKLVEKKAEFFFSQGVIFMISISIFFNMGLDEMNIGCSESSVSALSPIFESLVKLTCGKFILAIGMKFVVNFIGLSLWNTYSMLNISCCFIVLFLFMVCLGCLWFIGILLGCL